MNRMRTTATVLATAAVLTTAQFGLAGAATASGAAPAAAPRSASCPVSILYPSRFYVDSHNRVTDGGLSFAVRNNSGSKSFKKVTLTVTDVKNVRFGTAHASGGKVTHRTSKTVSVHAGTLRKGTSLGVRVHTRLLDTRHYKVRLTLRGTGWNCAVDQGTWSS